MADELKLSIPKELIMHIEIVPDNEGQCPNCGAYWGHPDEDLDYPNRSKVHDGNHWWYRCYNPYCAVGYFVPGYPDLVELAEPKTEDELLAEGAYLEKKLAEEPESWETDRSRRQMAKRLEYLKDRFA